MYEPQFCLGVHDSHPIAQQFCENEYKTRIAAERRKSDVNTFKLIANSLEEFCFGWKPNYSSANTMQSRYRATVDSCITEAKVSIQNGNSVEKVEAHFATNICQNQCVRWWRIIGRNFKHYHLYDAGSAVFYQRSDAQAYCVKEYENRLSSNLTNVWITLGLKVMEFKAKFLNHFCFGRKPNAVNAKKMEERYKKALSEYKKISKRCIRSNIYESSAAVNTFAADICVHFCLPWWRDNVKVHRYINDSGQLVECN